MGEREKEWDERSSGYGFFINCKEVRRKNRLNWSETLSMRRKSIQIRKSRPKRYKYVLHIWAELLFLRIYFMRGSRWKKRESRQNQYRKNYHDAIKAAGENSSLPPVRGKSISVKFHAERARRCLTAKPTQKKKIASHKTKRGNLDFIQHPKREFSGGGKIYFRKFSRFTANTSYGGCEA